MRIALAQQNYVIGDFDGNTEKIIAAIREARREHADIIVFSELCVCGYAPRDFLEFNDFIEMSYSSIGRIAAEADGIAVIVGAPSRNENPKGKDLYNSAFFLENKAIKKVIHKTLLPTYDIFDEVRYFESNTTFETIEFKEKKIALVICEDLWNTVQYSLYVTTPMDELKKQNPDFIINISASPFDYLQAKERISMLREITASYHLPIFYCNTVGAQTELIFDGGSLVMSPNGKIFDEMPYFSEAIHFYDSDEVQKNISNDHEQPKEKIKLIHDALIQGIRDYFKKLSFTQAIIGLSGGIDSAVVLTLAAEALGKENIFAILMPSEFSSSHSVTDSIQLCRNLDIKYDEISIEKVFNEYLKSLAGQFAGTFFNLAEENLQARIRAGFLMAISNKKGYILLNTSNKSEMAVGYGTLYGDMCGGLSVIGDLYKTEVYQLAGFIGREKKIIPQNIILKEPSAELHPDQKDKDSLPEYPILDKILFAYIEQRKGLREIIEMGFEKKLVERILRMVNTNEYKRYQTPPVLRVSPKSFGSGRRLPIVGKYLS